MIFTPTTIPDIILIEPNVFGDERGFFMETYQLNKFAKAGISTNFVQDNHSGSQQGTLRGLHYQIKQTQGKLVRVIAGEVFDIAVDIRRNSSTFGQWVGEHLSAENRKELWVPPGFAHGFYVLSKWAEIVYKATNIYAPQWERSLIWNDSAIGIEWPLRDGKLPVLSEKDMNGKLLKDADLLE